MSCDNDNNDNNTGHHGNRGKFNDRLAKIRRDRIINRKKFPADNSNEKENVIINSSRNVLKVILALPSIIYSNFRGNKNSVVEKSSDVLIEDNKCERSEFSNQLLSNDNVQIRNNKLNEIRKMNIVLLKKRKELLIKNNIESIINDKNSVILNDKEQRVVFLQKQIIDLIKKNLVEKINELEVLNSELYLLKELNGNDVYLKDCQDDIKEIKKLLSKIKALKEKYDYLKNNIDFEYVLEYEDTFLIDKILELKSLCSDNDVRYVVDNYKILDEYKYLYLKFDKLQESTIKYEEYKNMKVQELKQRDIDFDKLKNEVYDIDKEGERYTEFVKKQEMLLADLDDKILKINSYENVNYRLKGFDQLLGNSFKYLGLLLMHPLKSFLPGIAIHTLITKNTICNLYNNLEWEENRRMVYEAIDYSEEINRALNNLDLTSALIDSTLENIVRLKARYQKEFSSYEYSFSGYSETIKKLNKMENAVLGNKIKIMKLQKQMKEKERQNNNKLKIVKKLNNSSNNS